MTYRICVWEGKEPASAWGGELDHHRLAEEHEGRPLTPTMLAFLACLIQEWPPMPPSEGHDFATHTWPVALNAYGPVMCLQVAPDFAKSAVPRIIALAREQQLAVHIPQDSECREFLDPPFETWGYAVEPPLPAR